jgi:hypothetical protein
MPSRKRVLGVFKRHPILTVALLKALTVLEQKNVERLLAHLERVSLVRALPFLGNKKLYSLTRRGAQKLGFDGRKFCRLPA